jgi:hypothetical protein
MGRGASVPHLNRTLSAGPPRFVPGGLFGSASPDWNQGNAIDRSATRGETLRCGFN